MLQIVSIHSQEDRVRANITTTKVEPGQYMDIFGYSQKQVGLGNLHFNRRLNGLYIAKQW
jgi:hypothetical protein